MRDAWAPWLLSSVFGGLRPWEIEDFRPGELEALVRYRRELAQAEREAGVDGQ